MTELYRQGVGIMLVNKNNQVFVGQRKDTKKYTPILKEFQELGRKQGVSARSVFSIHDEVRVPAVDDAQLLKGEEYEAWQMPQGGIDEGEEPITAAFRELKEEIGTNHAELIAKASEWISYDLPPEIAESIWQGKYKGQRHMWFLFRFLGDDSEINIKTPEPEFISWKWCSHTELVANIVDFKKELYIQVLKQFESYLK